MKPFHISSYYDKFPPHQSINFWYSMILLSQKIISPESHKNILDFGCGTGEFLHLYNLMDNLKQGIGVEIDLDLLAHCRKHRTNNIDYCHNDDKFYIMNKDFFDVAFSQEVMYTIENLEIHAENMFSIIRPGGFYFATIGCHIESPLWSLRRELIRKEEKYYAYDYSIDQIANIFYGKGFEVGVKRLSPELPYIFHPKITRDFSNSLIQLIDSTDDRKIIFSFYKPIRRE